MHSLDCGSPGANFACQRVNGKTEAISGAELCLMTTASCLRCEREYLTGALRTATPFKFCTMLLGSYGRLCTVFGELWPTVHGHWIAAHHAHSRHTHKLETVIGLRAV